MLAGSGLSWQEGEVYEVGTGDCIVHRVAEETHTMIGGADGLDVLVFGERTDPPLTYLPRAKVARMGVTARRLSRPASVGSRRSRRRPRAPGSEPAPRQHQQRRHAADRRGRCLGRARRCRRLRPQRAELGSSSKPGAAARRRTATRPRRRSSSCSTARACSSSGRRPAPGASTRTSSTRSTRSGPGMSISRPPGTRIAHSFRAGRRRPDLSRLRHRGTQTTFATTRDRTRSSGAG